MPATLDSPGAYIEAVASGVRTIRGAATSITAFVGRTRRGKLHEPVLLTSFAARRRSTPVKAPPSSSRPRPSTSNGALRVV